MPSLKELRELRAAQEAAGEKRPGKSEDSKPLSGKTEAAGASSSSAASAASNFTFPSSTNTITVHNTPFIQRAHLEEQMKALSIAKPPGMTGGRMALGSGTGAPGRRAIKEQKRPVRMAFTHDRMARAVKRQEYYLNQIREAVHAQKQKPQQPATTERWGEPHGDPSNPAYFVAQLTDQMQRIANGSTDPTLFKLMVNNTHLRWSDAGVRAFLEEHPEEEAELEAAAQTAVGRHPDVVQQLERSSDSDSDSASASSSSDESDDSTVYYKDLRVAY